VLGQGLPGLWLRGLHPRQQVGRVQRPRRVVARRIALAAWRGVKPAVGAQVVADVFLEGDFVVQGHGGSQQNKAPSLAIQAQTAVKSIVTFQLRLKPNPTPGDGSAASAAYGPAACPRPA